MSDLYIGLMSGTSADGIDAALVDFSNDQTKLLTTSYMPYSADLRNKILALCQQGENEIKRLGELDILLGNAFADAVNGLLTQNSLSSSAIKAIGSHGQTIRHYPRDHHPFTLQIGDPNTIAAKTNITTIADFRGKDIALGGQGAPLVPAFHQYLFASTQTDRAIVNIGGIANITLLSAKNPELVIGFDTGPGNVLMDAWIFMQQKKLHDENGNWAQSGTSQQTLLNNMLDDTYFKLATPKSTGREYFNLSWLQNYLANMNEQIATEDVQATLADLTAQSILNDVKKYFTQGELFICGGGANNQYLMQRLQLFAESNFHVYSTEQQGIHPDWVEAIAFAWLAKQTLNRKPSNLPSVTGAKMASILGGIYYN